ncbi:MAG: large conductance mechanosensitive channel protein MscL [Methanothrix sp.]|nr:large conductance mechanosensitive channel protein MscL [Methanothrix sp.]
MGFIGEFKDFAMKGNVLDMAIGIIIGVAFGGIINSLVKDVIMPPIGLIMGGTNFADLFIALDGKTYASLAAAQAVAAPTINYGLFINAIINFLIVALAIFMLIRQVNAAKKKPAPPEPNSKDCPFCKESIPKAAVKCSHCTSDLK